jgi:DNA-binding NtrC family response regulator
MPKIDGIEVLQFLVKDFPEIPVIMISGHGDLETAVESMRLGAFDYISKPPDLNRLLNSVRSASKNNVFRKKSRIILKKSKNFKIIGESSSIIEINNIIEKVAKTDAKVLITGPNGSGKELVANQIHINSSRHQGPFIEVNCAAIPSELIESELFGHIKGAFTSAIKDKIGKFEAANGGTIFLDEIGDMSLEEIRLNNFREDLFHRLAVIEINVPSLNQRLSDIPLLIDHFLNEISRDSKNTYKDIEDNAVKLLQKFDWSGNVRELRNVMERLTILSENIIISKNDVVKYSGKYQL